ncbi:MAG: ATP-binding protein [Desulfobacteraceae bacterium]
MNDKNPFGNYDADPLCVLFSTKEEWLLHRLTAYVIEREFGKYVPPLIESWRLAINGVTESLIIGMKQLFPELELGPDHDYIDDPVCRFAVLEARRHRDRGVSLNMFMGLLVYFRQVYTDLILDAAFDPLYEKNSIYIIQRLFDRMLIAIAMEWTEYDQVLLIQDLQANNRLMTNEKNKYLSIFESHPHHVFILDHDYRIDNMNHSAASLFYRTRLPGSQYYQVIKEGELTIPVLRVSETAPGDSARQKAASTDLFPWLAEDLKSFGDSTDPIRDFEKKISAEHGSVYYHIKLSRTFDPGNQIQGIILLMEDITARKKAAAALRREKEKADRANRAKSTFLANMSHELRTPLNAILGFTGLMKRSAGLTEEQARSLEIITGSGENLLSLINNVLDISKIEAGHMVREDSNVNLKHLLREIEAMISLKMAEKGLQFEMSLSPDLLDHVIIDPDKLRQVLTNLLTNAVKFTENGFVSLKAHGDHSDSAGPAWLYFEVKDSGIGITRQDQEKIFLPFVQVGLPSASKSGTGLGLAICKQYTELMDGTINLDSEPGKGSTFHVRIPVDIPDKSSPVLSRPAYDQVIGVTEAFQHIRMVIAEDNRENMLLLYHLLDPLGFELKTVENGKAAVEINASWHPRLIWMDIRMPVMNGLEAARLIRRSKKGDDPKIVAVTAHALEQEREEIMAAGCDGFIRKPYKASDVYDMLVSQLGVEFVFSRGSVPQVMESGAVEIFNSESFKGISNLPEEKIHQLKHAALRLDEGQCFRLINDLGKECQKSGAHLRQMVENFQYRDMLALLDRALKEEHDP